ncbi:hypothetical protein J5N97_029898 [Dioscorea zingiberensis]|uniref:Uncharacterized protein n=1 Tax=Dioscorea zingiberensis TaxID=325984 RepID=A0A9D5H3J3_9LILI|nr:hypothetical protein J5N97_029898 [Dioscorea zingiberensis]
MRKNLFGLKNIDVYSFEPSCFFARPKLDRFNADRTLLEEQSIKEHHLKKSNLPLDCRSSGYLLAAY